MFKLDEDIQRTYFRLAEYQHQRMWMERLRHPENLKWRGEPPKRTETTTRRVEVLASMGFDETFYERMVKGENEAGKELISLVQYHVLWPHMERIKILSGPYLGGAFIAAGGDIRRCPTTSAFWYGMGLDILPDGTVPRRKRGLKDVERKVPALPFVTKVGEQIRMQINRTVDSKTRLMYEQNRAMVDAKNLDRAKLFDFKDALRRTQKILYACLWEEWRKGYGLDAPWPYAFAILKHDDGSRITIKDFYDKPAEERSQVSRATEGKGKPVH
jgi:hypothetical protein